MNIMGFSGVLLVLISGWTTANPIIYRAGLAFQGINKRWKRTRITLIAGGIASIIGIFPGLSMRFLDFAALYGVILMPMGAVIFADHYFMKPRGLNFFFAEKEGIILSATCHSMGHNTGYLSHTKHISESSDIFPRFAGMVICFDSLCFV